MAIYQITMQVRARDVESALRKTGIVTSVVFMTDTIDDAEDPEVREKATPAQIKASIGKDELTCLECGKGFRTLKRHLMTHHQLTPQQYRERWGLPTTYPVVAPAYSAKRSELAREAGLGRV